MPDSLSSEGSKTAADLGRESWDPVEERLAIEALQRRLFGEPRDVVQVGRYRIDERIGHGGMGVVYRAHDPKLERDVAVKLIRPQSAGSAGAHERLLEEAKTLAGVSHPNVVEVYDTGSFDVAEVFGVGKGAGVFMVMALVDGQTLQEWLQRPRRWKDVLPPLIAAGQGLVAVHDAGLVHRDFKPGNVLMGEPVRVVDFGLATAMEGGSSEIVVAGTPGYMAPEQFEGNYSPKSDQYSFCASLWNALYGSAPPSAEDVSKQTWRPPPNSRVPRWLHALIERGLDPNPDARHADMRAVLVALRRDSQRRARWVGLVAGLGIAGAVGFAAGGDTDPRCVEPPLGGAWNTKTSAEIKTQFLATDLAFARSAFEELDAYMDRFVGQWADIRRQTCALEPSNARGHALGCLRRKELQTLGLLEVYREPDPILLERLSSTLDDVLPPSTCIEDAPKSRPPLEPNADLERAVVFFDLGRNERAREALERASDVVEDPRQRAAVAKLRCKLAGDEGHYERAIEICTQAWRDAESAGLPAGAARMLLVLAQHRKDVDYERAWEALTIAEAKIASMDSATSLRLRSVAVRAELLSQREPELAVALLRANIADKEGFYGKSTTRTVYDRVTLAGLLEELGRFDEARAVYDKTQSRVEERLGPRHPHLAVILNNRALIEILVGRYEEARELFTDALELKLATPGWNTTRAASTHANLARLHDLLGASELAEIHARAAVAASGDSPSLFVVAMLVRVLRHADKGAEALKVAQEAWDTQAARRDDVLGVELALAELAIGRAEAGREVLLEVIASFETSPWPLGSEQAAYAAMAQLEAARGDAPAALAAHRRASGAFEKDRLRPGEWALACADMADALQSLSAQRAGELREQAKRLFAQYAPEHPRAGAP